MGIGERGGGAEDARFRDLKGKGTARCKENIDGDIKIRKGIVKISKFTFCLWLRFCRGIGF
jgi:hypothetical protein